MLKTQNDQNLLGLRVADHVSAMLAYWDRDLVCRFANAAYMDWFGRRRDEMVDKITIKELLGPLYEKNLPYILGALKGKNQTFEREIPTPTGGIRHSIANYFPDIVDGEVKGFFVHVADITPIKLLEKELIQSNEIISNQNKRLVNFANIVSHNLRSYANNLKTILELFINANTEKEKEEMLVFLKAISNGFSITVNHLNEIVEIQNQSTIKSELINLRDFVDKAVEILRIQIKSTHATVKNNVPADITLMANAAYMESVILNFLTNAIKYKHPARDPIIECDCIGIGGELILKITDNGLGINLKKHGTSLFSMHKTFHGNEDAKGIGLFITKSQVEAMGGRIEVESEEDKGTTFRVYLKVTT